MKFPMDENISPQAKHVLQTLAYAMASTCDQTLTAGEIRIFLRRLHGATVDQEVRQYFASRLMSAERLKQFINEP